MSMSETPEMREAPRRVSSPPEGWRLGRCNNEEAHGGRRPAFAWPPRTLKLGDVRCPGCGLMPDPTTRLVRGGFRLIDGDELLAQAVAAGSRAYTRKLEMLAQASALRDHERPHFAAQYDRLVDHAGRDHDRLRKLVHRLADERSRA